MRVLLNGDDRVRLFVFTVQIPGRIQKLPDQRLSSSNSVGGEKVLDCDYYTETLCLGVRDYPRQEISSLLGANRRLSHDMIADVSSQSADDLIDGVSSSKMMIISQSD